ncbi:hypothetical protein ART_1604 [Arthrobacter sp. PAMC 25486]|uniref:hypothetical protein n=1 Tax=Arthrobacter sp. PAMC 25486 TaxID=1494608 RepID=UPI0005360808|nr:hypothetical protein [Arthrobacter sp. PAMC 25486]AIY01203.1 hypothetical protein ART_1604 [Arthrobacter sp. PAMC 25486]
MDVPAGLGVRGSALWSSMATADVPRNALVLEASRLADRLDELDSIIQGKGVLNLMQFRLDDIDYDSQEMSVTVSFASPLAEARQQATALAGILTKLAPAEASAKPVRQSVPADLPSNVSPLQKLQSKLNG